MLSAVVAAATEAVCCHSMDTRARKEASILAAEAKCATGLDGNGRTSISLPLSSISSCHPGKVESKLAEINAKTIAAILQHGAILVHIMHADNTPK